MTVVETTNTSGNIKMTAKSSLATTSSSVSKVDIPSSLPDKNRILSPREIEHLIAIGNALVIYESYVVKLNHWLTVHPGGDLAICHMIGRDATDEMNAYHALETIASFKKFSIGKINYRWENMLPPIQGGVYRKLDSMSNNSKAAKNKVADQQQQQPIGQQKVQIVPKIPQGMIPSINTPQLYETHDDNDDSIRDPKLVIENFDNNLVKLDLARLPSLDYDTQLHLSQRYNELHDKITQGNFYQCPYIEYFKEFCRIGSLVLWCFILLKLGYYKISAICIGLAWQQAVFIAHDAGHIGITHNYQIDNIIGMLIASWFGGLSLGWWKRSHNIHHLITNDPVHDPDIQHLPFFAVSSRLFGDIFSTYYNKTLWFDCLARSLVPIQRYLYYPILAFGRFNLYRLSVEHLVFGLGPTKGKAAWFRYFELVGLCFFWYWFGYKLLYKSLDNGWQRFNYIMISHITTMIVHVQITLSHFAMSTSDLGTSESFVSRQIRTTMDVDCPEWLDYVHGGLQFQTIHHLFPRLPRHNLRKVQNFVIEFCNEVGLQYSIYGFVTGNDVVLTKMADVSKQVKIFKDCLQNMQSEALDGGNLYELKVKTVLKNSLPKHEYVVNE